MATILFTVTNGTNDPTRASIPFVGASGAIANGDNPQIALLGDGAYLAIQNVRESVHGVGVAPMKDLFAKMVEHAVPIFV